MQTLATDPVTETLTITHVPAAPDLLHMEPGAQLRWGDHDPTDHQIVVVKGTCRVLGRQLHAGASVFVPAGLDHSLRAGAWGCSLYSVHTATRIA